MEWARGEQLGATAPWQNRTKRRKDKPALNTKLRILPLPAVSFKYHPHNIPNAVFIGEMIDDAPLDAVSSISIPDWLHYDSLNTIIRSFDISCAKVAQG